MQLTLVLKLSLILSTALVLNGCNAAMAPVRAVNSITQKSVRMTKSVVGHGARATGTAVQLLNN